MKNKLFLIHYIYKNPDVEHDATHYEHEYYLTPSLAKAITVVEFTVLACIFMSIFRGGRGKM